MTDLLPRVLNYHVRFYCHVDPALKSQYPLLASSDTNPVRTSTAAHSIDSWQQALANAGIDMLDSLEVRAMAHGNQLHRQSVACITSLLALSWFDGVFVARSASHPGNPEAGLATAVAPPRRPVPCLPERQLSRAGRGDKGQPGRAGDCLHGRWDCQWQEHGTEAAVRFGLLEGA